VLREAAVGGTPFSNRLLFSTMLMQGMPTDPEALFETFWEHMVGNFRRQGMTEVEAKARLKRFLYRKLVSNNQVPDEQGLFQGVDTSIVDDDFAVDEGAPTAQRVSAAEFDGILNTFLIHH